MSIVKEIFKNLNEGAEVKKPYGDKPEEGKKEKLQKGKKVNVPKAKGNFEKYKARKLEAKNKNAETIYASDTDKVMDKIDSTVHSDKGEVAKVNTKKADRKVKFPFGDKVQKSDSKLIKESAFDESSDPVEILKAIHEQYVNLGMEDEFYNDCLNHMDTGIDELISWFKMGESEKLSESNMRSTEIRSKLKACLPKGCTLGKVKPSGTEILYNGKELCKVKADGLHFIITKFPSIKFDSESDTALDELAGEIEKLKLDNEKK